MLVSRREWYMPKPTLRSTEQQQPPGHEDSADLCQKLVRRYMLKRLKASHYIKRAVLERHVQGIRDDEAASPLSMLGTCRCDAVRIQIDPDDMFTYVRDHPDSESVSTRDVQNALVRVHMAQSQLIVVAQLIAMRKSPSLSDLQSLDFA